MSEEREARRLLEERAGSEQRPTPSAEGAEGSRIRLDRLQLARALLEYDDDEPSQRAARSAILTPFQHILSAPQLSRSTSEPSMFADSGTSDSLPPHAPTSLSGLSSDPRTSMAMQRRYSGSLRGTSQLTWAKAEAAAAAAGSNELEEDEEERLVGSWGMGELLSQLGSPSPSSDKDNMFGFHTVSTDDLETRSLPDLLHPRSTSPLHDASTPRLRVLSHAGSRDRARSFDQAGILELPTFEPFLADVLDGGPSATRRANLSISSARPLLTSSRPSSRLSLSDSLSHVDPSSTEARPPSRVSVGRTASALSTTPTTFTSRFDPAMLAIARQELEADRPVFRNKDAGGPPKLVLMPTPLSGRPPSPPRRVRVEGPDSDDEMAGYAVEQVVDASRELFGDGKPQRPAGALYGRSLMDVLAERKALAKAQQRQHIPFQYQDGRRAMSDGIDSPTGQALQFEGGTPAKAVPRSKSTMSVFGPDLLYERELTRRIAEEAEEAKVRAEQEQRDTEKKESERLSREAKLLKKQKHLARAATIRKLEGADLQRCSATAGESPPPQPPRRTHVAAPSLSLPTGLHDATADVGPWFSPPSPQKSDSSSSSDAPVRFPPLSSSRPPLRMTSSEDEAASIRARVMLGTITASEAVAEASRLGLGTQSSMDSQDSRPLGERLSSHSSGPPRLHINLDNQGFQLSAAEKADLLGLGGDTPPDEDDVPLGLKYAQSQPFDDDDVPLGLRRMTMLSGPPPAHGDYDDDRPLGFTLLQHRHHQQQQEAMYLHAQQVRYQAALANLQTHAGYAPTSFSQSSGLDSTSFHPAGLGGNNVEQWRRSVM